MKPSSLSAVEAAKYLGEDNSVSLLLAGSGPSVQDAAAHAASCHPSVSRVLQIFVLIFLSFLFILQLYYSILRIIGGSYLLIEWWWVRNDGCP